MTKIVAYYLPQFHSIPENDLWWGKGFTEWLNVKASRPLFPTHKQPYLPLNKNFYNLLNKETMEWQASLCRKYGVYGWAIYHYWYNGKLLLEKPVQNLLTWKDIPIHFCFTWANHDWTNSWIGGNDVYLKQDYGDENDWRSHFNYLSAFFHDQRYIKIDNKPLFIIYRPQDIPNLGDLISFFNRRCVEEGFNGIYIINTIWEPQELANKEVVDKCDALTFKEFRYSQIALRNIRTIHNRLNDSLFGLYLKLISANGFEVYSYRQLVNMSYRLMSKLSIGKPLFYNVFTSWDTTPRYKEKASIVLGATPSAFKKNLKRMLRLSWEKSSDYLFVRAWNEWGQSMALEPSQEFGYGFLESVQAALSERYCDEPYDL